MIILAIADVSEVHIPSLTVTCHEPDILACALGMTRLLSVSEVYSCPLRYHVYRSALAILLTVSETVEPSQNVSPAVTTGVLGLSNIFTLVTAVSDTQLPGAVTTRLYSPAALVVALIISSGNALSEVNPSGPDH